MLLGLIVEKKLLMHIYVISKLKKKNYPNSCRKELDKIQHPLMIKTPSKLGIEGTSVTWVKVFIKTVSDYIQ